MGFIKNITAGFVGSVALNILHETLRKNASNVPHINVIGEQALNQTLGKFGTPITDEDELHQATLKADIVANTMYYSLIGGNKNWIWPKAILLGLSAGIGALKLPEPMGLDPEPVTRTNQTKVLTVSYYLFGALVTGLVLKTLSKK
ncbi:MAG: hypothetical protein EOP00_05580 [Pedobacter sp.]|nr:MAG: hypothetical protein EOP00_05580 [Pedobacter sp.]